MKNAGVSFQHRFLNSRSLYCEAYSDIIPDIPFEVNAAYICPPRHLNNSHLQLFAANADVRVSGCTVTLLASTREAAGCFFTEEIAVFSQGVKVVVVGGCMTSRGIRCGA